MEEDNKDSNPLDDRRGQHSFSFVSAPVPLAPIDNNYEALNKRIVYLEEMVKKMSVEVCAPQAILFVNSIREECVKYINECVVTLQQAMKTFQEGVERHNAMAEKFNVMAKNYDVMTIRISELTSQYNFVKNSVGPGVKLANTLTQKVLDHIDNGTLGMNLNMDDIAKQ